jgi:hypothetical protein
MRPGFLAHTYVPSLGHVIKRTKKYHHHPTRLSLFPVQIILGKSNMPPFQPQRPAQGWRCNAINASAHLAHASTVQNSISRFSRLSFLRHHHRSYSGMHRGSQRSRVYRSKWTYLYIAGRYERGRQHISLNFLRPRPGQHFQPQPGTEQSSTTATPDERYVTLFHPTQSTLMSAHSRGFQNST